MEGCRGGGYCDESVNGCGIEIACCYGGVGFCDGKVGSCAGGSGSRGGCGSGSSGGCGSGSSGGCSRGGVNFEVFFSLYFGVIVAVVGIVIMVKELCFWWL